MPFGTLFSAVVKPAKPLLYICDDSTQITNIAISPPASVQKDAKPLEPFMVVLKLQYEGPVIEGEHEEEGKEDKKAVKKTTATKKPAAGDDSDGESEDSDFDGVDIEAKEVVIGCFTPNTLQLTTDIFLAPNDQYRFVVSGSADYEVHLLGRYIPDEGDESPYGFGDDDDSDEDMDDFELDQLPSDDDESEGGRIEELDDEPVKAKPNGALKVAEKAAKPMLDKTAEKAAKPVPDKKANKRPLEDKEADPDVSMADSTVSGADGGAKLSKSQRKKLKKSKSLEAAGAAAPGAAAPGAAAPAAVAPGPAAPAAAVQAPKVAEKASPAAKPAAPSTVTLPSGLKITDVKIGQGAAAKPGQKVAMRYIGKLTNGKVFDSNTKGTPFNFVLGKGQVIKGWDEGIKGMKLGGERKLIVPANLAYGKNGAPPDIPPNSTLMFEVKLLSAK